MEAVSLARNERNENSADLLFDGQFLKSLSSKPNSRLAHTCQLDIDQIADSMRQTCIVCTLGDSWSSEADIERMVKCGMNILALNLSMTSREKCEEAIRIVRSIEKSLNFSPPIGIAMDMTAAPVRTGIFEGGINTEVILKEGSRVELTLDEEFRKKCTSEKIFISTRFFPKFIHSVHRGDRISLDDGQIVLIAKDVGFNEISCLVEEGGIIGGYKRVTLPRERLFQDSVQGAYFNDLAFAAKCDVDFVFTSFADNAKLIQLARSYLPSNINVFVKIETREAVKNIAELIKSADGVIVRRSNLATEYSSEKIFKIQKNIIGLCNVAEKPVFVMEQLLETMRVKPRPTRAESSDVANAVLDGADGIVLTIETSWGKYPFEAVTVVDQICREAEHATFLQSLRQELTVFRGIRIDDMRNITHVTGASAVEAASSCEAKAIFVITTSGLSAKSIAASKPNCITIAITRNIKVGRHCQTMRGLHPFIYTGEHLDEWSEDMDLRINAAITEARLAGIVAANDTVVIVTGMFAGVGSTNTIRILQVPSEERKLKVVSSSHLLHSEMDVGSRSQPSALLGVRRFHGVQQLNPMN